MSFGDRRSVAGFELRERGASIVGLELMDELRDRGASVVGFELMDELRDLGASVVGFELMDRGERSTESRGFCKGEGESVSDLATPLLTLVTLGVAGEALLLAASDIEDLDLEDMVVTVAN